MLNFIIIKILKKNNIDLRGEYDEAQKGSIISLVGLLIVLVAAGFIFFTMISDQIFFKK